MKKFHVLGVVGLLFTGCGVDIETAILEDREDLNPAFKRCLDVRRYLLREFAYDVSQNRLSVDYMIDLLDDCKEELNAYGRRK